MCCTILWLQSKGVGMNCNVFNANIIKRSISFLIHGQLLQLIQGLQAINNSTRKTQVLEIAF